MSAGRVTRLTESDWQVFAALRLRALADGLGTDDDEFRREERFTEEDWRARLRDHPQFAAWLADRPVGLLGAYRQNADTVYLYSLWVEPAARGRGLARALVSAVLTWARAQQARVVYLKVAVDNAAARNVYASLGFTAVEEGLAPAGELAMALRVDQLR